MMSALRCALLAASFLTMAVSTHAEDFNWSLRVQERVSGTAEFTRSTRAETWPAERTAFVVCDVWDKHHCLNAVRRLEEFGPRLNDVLTEARRRGAIIIHAPSDCMPAYEQHPARLRELTVPAFDGQPDGAADWCSRIPAEEQAVYPIDQSDGGEDDDPAEHAAWAAELTALGRDPAMPWKTQSPLITIDPDHDYISDRGDEVWRILKHNRVEHVVLTGVHTNMCVLGRPFGLRQMVRNGFDVVLMRDMTDCMYNPARWPYVDHFTGNDLIISHVERYVCPTVTSDQVLGGSPFRFRGDTRDTVDVMQVDAARTDLDALRSRWVTAQIPATWSDVTGGTLSAVRGIVWYRAAVVIPKDIQEATTFLEVSVLPPKKGTLQAWLNGQELSIRPLVGGSPGRQAGHYVLIPHLYLNGNDPALLVIRADAPWPEEQLLHSPSAPSLLAANGNTSLAGRWQVRIGDNPEWSGIPLPAKFGAPPDILIEPGL